jgi:hypothetical protein
VLGYIGNGGSSQARADVMPPALATHLMVVAVEAVASADGWLDAVYECNLIVDHDELFVMAVKQTFLCVGCEMDSRVPA